MSQDICVVSARRYGKSFWLHEKIKDAIEQAPPGATILTATRQKAFDVVDEKHAFQRYDINIFAIPDAIEVKLKQSYEPHPLTFDVLTNEPQRTIQSGRYTTVVQLCDNVSQRPIDLPLEKLSEEIKKAISVRLEELSRDVLRGAYPVRYGEWADSTGSGPLDRRRVRNSATPRPETSTQEDKERTELQESSVWGMF